MSEARPYIMGYHPSVLKSHGLRTAQNSCQFLLPTLQSLSSTNPSLNLLDVGCGPGTITSSLASLFPSFQITALDLSPEALGPAKENAKTSGVENITFVPGDTYALPFQDNTFDIVTSQQLLQHLSNPSASIKEMLRVTKPGGLVALREGDVPATFWYPESKALETWIRLIGELQERGPPGRVSKSRELRKWIHEAGVRDEEMKITAGTWCYSSPEERAAFGSSWMERVTESDFASNCLKHGLASRDELEEVRKGWKGWIEHPDGFLCIVHAEALITVS